MVRAVPGLDIEVAMRKAEVAVKEALDFEVTLVEKELYAPVTTLAVPS